MTIIIEMEEMIFDIIGRPICSKIKVSQKKLYENKNKILQECP